MRRLVADGTLGRLGMIAAWNYTNFLYRPRRPEELDTAQGGGIVFNQVPHQIDMARLIGGGRVRSVRAALGALDPARPTEGQWHRPPDFESGAAASLVYSGYDFFDSDELHFVGERGRHARSCRAGTARRAARSRARHGAGDRAARRARLSRRSTGRQTQPHLPHFGLVIVTCEKGEMRASADGIIDL